MSEVDILAFGAHPDDVELSCSGTLYNQIQAGAKVAIVDLTEGELGSRGTPKTRYAEAEAAKTILGVHFRENLQMPDGFIEKTPESIKKVIVAIRKYRPKIILANAVRDRHSDHKKGAELVSEAAFLSGLKKIETITEEGDQEAYRPKALYHYIQDQYLDPDFVVDITNAFDVKMESVKAYTTQFYQEGADGGPQTPISGQDFLKFLEGRAREMGRKIQCEYGEGFVAARTVGVQDLFNLL